MIAESNQDAPRAYRRVAKPANVLSTMAKTATMMNQNISGFLRRSGRISSFRSRVGRGVVTRPVGLLWRAMAVRRSGLDDERFGHLVGRNLAPIVGEDHHDGGEPDHETDQTAQQRQDAQSGENEATHRTIAAELGTVL